VWLSLQFANPAKPKQKEKLDIEESDPARIQALTSLVKMVIDGIR